MDGDRDWIEELREMERMEERHSAERLEEENRLLRHTAHNPAALAAAYGVDASDNEFRLEAFDDALECRRRVSERIERCGALEEDLRGRLAHELSLLSLHGDDPGADVNEFLQHFRAAAGDHLSDPEVRGICQELSSLRLYADLSRSD